jgi:hypothetical protein
MRHIYLIIIEFILLFSFNSCTITEADDPVIVSGTITDSYGAGLGDVTVQLETTLGTDEVITNSNGKYIFNLPSGGTGSIIFSKDRFTTQKKTIAFAGGSNKVINLQMKTLVEDSYFDINAKDLSFSKIGGEVFATVHTNMDYEIEYKSDWIICSKHASSIIIKYDTNYTSEERKATVLITTQYGKTITINVTQEAGPPLAITDYLGKDNRTNFFTNIPFIVFSNFATISSANSSITGLDLTAKYSDDKKTTYFPNIILPAFTPAKITYSAESPSGEEKITGQFDIKAYTNCVNTGSSISQKVLFTKDSQYFWVQTNTIGGISLIQYSSNDMSVTGNISMPLNRYSTVSYNRYNNCLYISRKNESKIDIYDATNGQYIKELDLSSYLNGSSVYEIEFAENGYGLMLVNNLLYYINSADNNKCGLFPNDASLVDPNNPAKLIVKTIATCNKGKTFVLTDKYGEINKVFAIDSYSKSMTSYYNLRDYYFATSDAYFGVILGSSNNITYIDFSTGLKYDVASNYVGNRASIIITGEKLPTILTSVFSKISIKDGKQNKFESNAPLSNIYPSNDGKTVVITYNNTIYLFNQDLFTINSNKIK